MDNLDNLYNQGATATTLYIVQRGSAWFVTDGAGHLNFVAYNITRSKGRGFGGQYDIVTGRFRGPDGAIWAFRNAGDNQIARCRRLRDPR